MARRGNDDANILLWVIFLIALYISTFFIGIPELDFSGVTCFGPLSGGPMKWPHTPFSAVMAALTLIIVALIIHFINNTYSVGVNHILPLLYLILAAANPSAVYLTPLHIAALLFVISTVFSVRFKTDEAHNSDFFVSVIVLMAASCFFVPLIWLLPLRIINCFSFAAGKARYLGASCFAILTGAAVIMGAAYLFSGFEAMTALPQRYLSILTLPHFELPDCCIMQLARIGLIAILVLVAFSRTFRNQDSYKIAEGKMLRSMMAASVALVPLMLLYLPDCRMPFGTLALAPASIVVFGLFEDSVKSFATVFSIVMMLFITAERLAICFDGWGVPFITMLIN